ncbi:MAG TPA: DUF6600 domain-containing protein [Ginsengibacter sp.]|nr:DUF6600 domain-containing protein [Ginsengibacter sp.]
MKNIYIYISLVVAMVLTSCSITNYPQSNYSSEPSDITYQQFYNDLSPYGDWVDYQNYGYVWIPNEIGFRPYYNNGHWIYSEYGWTWVSNYNWGWAPFHYGRWLYDYAYGWMWIPGYQWAPAWVSWRSGGDYYGWAPLGPGMDVNSNYGSNIPYDNWAFVPRRYINSPRINNYYVNRQQNVTIINNTTIVNNTRVINNNNVYITGPSPSDVERETHQKITPVRVEQRNNPGGERLNGNKLTLYKPVIKDVPQQREFKPAKLSNLNELKLRRERIEGANNRFPPNDNNGKELNPIDKVQEPDNTQKNNPPLIINRQREVGLPQKSNNDQKIQPNPGDIKNDNNNQGNERIQREKEFQQRIQQQKAENDRLIQEKQNQQRIQQQNAENERLLREKENQQRIQQNTDKKNDQFNNKRIQNPGNNQQPDGKNNPPANIRNLNRPNIKPQNNNIQPIQRNSPPNRPLNNQPPRINDNQKVILPPPGQPQGKEKKE